MRAVGFVLTLSLFLAGCGEFKLGFLGSPEEFQSEKIRIGDMVFLKSQITFAASDSVRTMGASGFNWARSDPWMDGIAPVRFAFAATQAQQDLFFEACREWSLVANVRCIPYSGQEDRIDVTVREEADHGCNSHVGRGPGIESATNMNLASYCWSKTTIVHELGHAFGFLHEHQRPDRDQYISINRANIPAGWEYAYDIISSGFVLGPYDFHSIMHYPDDGRIMQPRPGTGVTASQLGSARATGKPSTLDGQAMARIYGAPVVRPPPGYSGLNAYILDLDQATMQVTINGGITKTTNEGLTFDWGDGYTTTGFFPQSHVYALKGKIYSVTISVTYADTTYDSVPLSVYIPPPITINFRVQNGTWLQAENGGWARLLAGGPNPTLWETFTVIDPNGGTFDNGDVVSFQTSVGSYINAEGGGGGVVNANRYSIGAWEKFTIVNFTRNGPVISGDSIALRAPNGQYLVAEGGGGGLVNANRNSVGAWETFTVFVAGNSPPPGGGAGPGTGGTTGGTSGGTPPAPDRSVIGVIDGVGPIGDANYLFGWACAKTSNSSIQVHAYINGSAGSGQWGGNYLADFVSEPAIAQACAAWGNAYRFQIPLDNLYAQFANATIYVHGISPFGLANNLIANSGAFRLPAKNCSVAFTGTHDKVGLSNGDPRFLCFNNRWYDCGWEINQINWETKVAHGQIMGHWACNLNTRSWKSTNLSGDFTGDLKADTVVFRPSEGNWYVPGLAAKQWGGYGDIPVAADYDADGKPDYAVYRPSNGTWYLLLSTSGYMSAQSIPYGISEDKPLPGDYNGDGKSDVAVWRPSNGTWYISSIGAIQWGASTDIPVTGDYDGDRRTDISVFRAETSTWYFLLSTSNYTVGSSAFYGGSGDIPVVADYNGDGRSEVAVYKPSNGVWYIAGIGEFQWGTLGDIPVPGDYDGDRRSDLAVYRPSNGTWYILKSTSFYTAWDVIGWGISKDIPIRPF